MRREWSPEDLIGSWTLVGDDWRLVGNKSGVTRLGFSLLLKFFELEARFPRGPQELPAIAVEYVAGQVKVDPADFRSYPWDGRSAKYHREQIRAAFGFREFSRADEDKLADWLAEEVCPVELRDEQLHEALRVRCRAERIEPPGRADRIVGTARAVFERRFCDRTVSRLAAGSVEALNGLVAEDAGPLATGRNLLAELKSDPGKVSLETLLREIEKLSAVRALKLPPELFADASEKLVDAWRARAARMFPSHLRDAPEPVRLTLLAALCWMRSAEITDALVELLIELVHRINTHADRRVEKELTEDLRRVARRASCSASPRPRWITRTTSCGRRCIRWSGRRRCGSWCARPRPTTKCSRPGCARCCAARTPTTIGGCCRRCWRRWISVVTTLPTGR
ncbi:DUF4158 domain-containing protein [Nocardia sp. NPDC052278]|uniref:DUF4158 domain-containing protein n=1 Tax=unclassified Nocardia TaxID=2637762 RepID=UPI0036AC2DBA